MYNNSRKCVACDFVSDNLALLNRHISRCENYDEWIKTYKPEYFECKKCTIKFIDIERLNEHNCKK